MLGSILESFWGPSSLLYSFWVARWPKQASFWEVKFQVRLWSAKSDDSTRSRSVNVGRCERFAAEAGPLELKLRELCMEFCQQFSTPCYL